MEKTRIFPEFRLGGEAALFGGLAGLWVFLFGGWTAALSALAALVALDYLTGLAAAWVEGDLSSRAGLAGLMRKGAVFALVMVVNLTCGLAGGGEFGALNVSLFASILALNEALSVLENLRRLGVPIPEFLLHRLRGAKNALIGEEE